MATVMAVMMAVVVVTLLVMMHEALALCSGLSWAQGYPTSRTKVVRALLGSSLNEGKAGEQVN